MMPGIQFAIGLLLFAALGLHAQTPKPLGDLAARRRAAAEAIEISLEQQKLSIQKQARQEGASGGSFFQLSRPATLGATAAAPYVADAAPPCDPLPADQVDALVDSAAARESLDRDLLRGVIRQESAFHPCAVSPKGALGLMQLMPATAAQFGVVNPLDPEQNVDGGARLLKQLLSRYGGDLSRALGAYNAGPAQVDAVNGIPQIPETQDYVKQIMSLLPVKQ
jgi:soluble lytic murein transglycosylase-like protein